MSSKNNSIAEEKSYKFALMIIDLYKFLSGEKKEYVLSKQLLRSGTSIGANITEATGAISNADFSAKISIAYKESLESKYWLRLLNESDYINQAQFDKLFNSCDKSCKILFSILKTTRINKQKQ